MTKVERALFRLAQLAGKDIGKEPWWTIRSCLVELKRLKEGMGIVKVRGKKVELTRKEGGGK